MIKKLYYSILKTIKEKIKELKATKLNIKDSPNYGNSSFKSFKSVFSLVVFIIFVSSIFTVLFLNRVYFKSIQSFNKERLDYLNTNINSSLNNWFYSRINELFLLRDSYHLVSFVENINSGKKDSFVEDGLISKIDNQIKHYSLGSLVNISVANKDGMIYLSNDANKKGTSISSYSFYKSLKDGYTYITNIPFYNVKTKEYVYLIAMPVLNKNNEFIGIVLAYYRWENLLKNITGLRSGNLDKSTNYSINIIDYDSEMSVLLTKDKELLTDRVDWVKKSVVGTKGSIVQDTGYFGKQNYTNYLRFKKENNFDVDFASKLIFPNWVIVNKYQFNLMDTIFMNMSFLGYSSLVIFIYLAILVIVNYLLFFKFTKDVIGDDLFTLKTMLDSFLSMDLNYKNYLVPETGIVKKIYDLSFMFYHFTSHAKSNIITSLQYNHQQANEIKYIKSLNASITGDISKATWYNNQNANISLEIKKSLETIVSLNNDIFEILKNRNELVSKIKASKGLALSLNSTKAELEQLDLEFREVKAINVKNKEILSSINSKIKEIDEQSVELQNANQTIQTIATQTNLLSVNAAIEANSAGIAGKGFAIISEEIKSLSEDASNEALNTSNNLIRIKSDIYNLSKESELIKKSLSHFDTILDAYDTNRNVYKNNVYSKVDSINQSLDYLGLLENTLEENENFVSAMKKISISFSNDFDSVMNLRNTFNEYINKVEAGNNELKDKLAVIESLNSDELIILENTKKDLNNIFKSENTMEEID